MKKLIVGSVVVIGVLAAIGYTIDYMIEQEEVTIAFKDIQE